MPVNLHHGSILDLDVDAIVNAANTELQHGGSLAAAIVSEGGLEIQKESDAIGYCPLGSAVATSGGRLRARNVIHVPTIDYVASRRATLQDIEAGTKAAVDIARTLRAESVAFPLLGAGVVGLKAAEVAKTMREVLVDVRDLAITICVHWQGDWPTVETAFRVTS